MNWCFQNAKGINSINPLQTGRGWPGHIGDREGGGLPDLHVAAVPADGHAQAVGAVDDQEERLHHPRPRLTDLSVVERLQGRQGGAQRVAGDQSQDQGLLRGGVQKNNIKEIS